MTMQVVQTVEGSTFAELDFKKQQAIESFMAAAPEGATYAIVDIGVATKIDDKPAGWDAATSTVLTLPVYQLSARWEITLP